QSAAGAGALGPLYEDTGVIEPAARLLLNAAPRFFHLRECECLQVEDHSLFQRGSQPLPGNRFGVRTLRFGGGFRHLPQGHGVTRDLSRPKIGGLENFLPARYAVDGQSRLTRPGAAVKKEQIAVQSNEEVPAAIFDFKI